MFLADALPLEDALALDTRLRIRALESELAAEIPAG